VANLTFILPTWRIQPYFSIGPGAQYANLDAMGPFDKFGLDLKRWDFMLRAGFGLDAYVTENWLLNLELAPSVRFADYSRIPSKTTDNVQLTVSLGIQYRF
jgi:opacity protein-like surface antigen